MIRLSCDIESRFRTGNRNAASAAVDRTGTQVLVAL
jgi:hypothetical protein